MRNLVVIVGAGASVSAGLPSLAGIFEDQSVVDYLAGPAKEFRQFLERSVWTPRGIASDEKWMSMNLEEVLTMLRLWQDDNQAPLNRSRNLRLQRQLLGCVFKSVFVGKAFNGCLDYNNLIKLCQGSYDHVTWASYNWDSKLEQAFYYLNHTITDKGARLPCCLPGLVGWNGSNSNHLLLKLHGSVSWFKDGLRARYMRWGTTSMGNQTLDAWEAYLNGAVGASEPFIVEPSFFKHEVIINGDGIMREQWREFDRRLSNADVVLVVGYSLPDGDAMAKQSLFTAVARNPKAKWIIVDPDSHHQVMKKYERALGIPRLTFYAMSLTEFLDSTDLSALTNP